MHLQTGLLVATALLAGCAHSTAERIMHSPDGRPTFRIYCKNDKRPCHEEAKEVCAEQYDGTGTFEVLDEDGYKDYDAYPIRRSWVVVVACNERPVTPRRGRPADDPPPAEEPGAPVAPTE